MSDVRLMATNPDDSSVVPVACNSRGELLVADPVIEEIPNDVDFDGDVSITGKLTVGGSSVFKDSTFNGFATFSEDVVVNGVTVGKGAGGVFTNLAVGWRSYEKNTTGSNNTALGYFALQDNTTGSTNTALGSSALRRNTEGLSNTALGSSALAQNTEGQSNTAVGYLALGDGPASSSNTAIGRSALQLTTTGVGNVAVGNSAAVSNTEGMNNTAVGRESLIENETGTRNTAIGRNAGRLLTGSNNTFIGNYQGSALLNHTLSLSTGSTERMRIGIDDAVDFNQKCGFTADGGLWITDQRGNKVRTTFLSQQLMQWEPYEVAVRNEPQLSEEEIEEARTHNEYGY